MSPEIGLIARKRGSRSPAGAGPLVRPRPSSTSNCGTNAYRSFPGHSRLVGALGTVTSSVARRSPDGREAGELGATRTEFGEIGHTEATVTRT